MSNLKLLRKNELVKFIQKIGHHQAARIIEEHNIDGNGILNLTNNDILKWHLTVIEEEAVWKCINQLRLNQASETDSQRVCTNPKKSPSEPKTRQSIHNYFKFKPNVEQSKKHLLKSFENLTSEFESEMFIKSEYNCSSRTKMNNALQEQLKKYLTFNSNSKYQLLTSASNSHADLPNLTDNNCVENYMSVKYETLPVTKPEKQTILYSPTSQRRKLKHTKCYFKLCCVSCTISVDHYDE